MGDTRRFDLFGKVVNYHFGNMKKALIYDIAGGRGYLQENLRELGFKDVLTWEPSMRYDRARRARFRNQCFDFSKAPGEAGLVIGMHPDEGTDHIVKYAVKHSIPFVVCPCCIKPSAEAFWDKHTKEKWENHLQRIAEKGGFGVSRVLLKMNGRNTVLIGRPN